MVAEASTTTTTTMRPRFARYVGVATRARRKDGQARTMDCQVGSVCRAVEKEEEEEDEERSAITQILLVSSGHL